MFTHTIPFPHLSQMGSFCRFPVGGACLIVGAFTVLVPIGRVPVHKDRERKRQEDRQRELERRSSAGSFNREAETDLTVAVYKVLQGFEGAGLTGGVALLLVFL